MVRDARRAGLARPPDGGERRGVRPLPAGVVPRAAPRRFRRAPLAGRVGRGHAGRRQLVLYEELAAHDAPRLVLAFVAIHHAASTLLVAGTEEQRRRHLPAILDGEIWVQGFSEPEAGSDLAALKAAARRHGDVYVVNGQKVWASGAPFRRLVPAAGAHAIPTLPSATGSRTSSWTCGPRVSRCDRSGRRPASRTSARSSSTTWRSPHRS